MDLKNSLPWDQVIFATMNKEGILKFLFRKGFRAGKEGQDTGQVLDHHLICCTRINVCAGTH